MSAVKQGFLWLLLAALLATACWLGYRTYGEQRIAQVQATVGGEHDADWGRYSEM